MTGAPALNSGHLDDLTATRLCAEAMGLPKPIEVRGGAVYCGGHEARGFSGKLPQRVGGILYKPLHDDAQCLALVERLELTVLRNLNGWLASDGLGENWTTTVVDSNLNRASVYCVAKMQSARIREGSHGQLERNDG